MIWVEQRNNLMCEEAGELTVIATESIARDTTEHKRAEEALRGSEERFRGTFEQLPLSVQVLDPEGRTLHVNKAWERIWGITREQLGDYNVREDEQLVAKGVMPYIEKGFAGEPASIPPIAYQPEGEEFVGKARWVRGFIYPVKDEAGYVLEVVLMFEDITERREAEELFRATFEQAGVGVAHMDPDGRWLRVNQKLCDIVGYTPEELLEKTSQDITHPEDLDTDLQHLGRLVTGEKSTYSTEKRYFRKDGSIVWVDLMVTCVRSPSGEPEYFISFVQDVSQRKRAEEALLRSEERYRTFIEQSTEGICRFELERPLPIDTPEDDQIDHFYRYGRFAECNDAMARMYGYALAEEMVGTSLGDLLPRSVPENAAYLRAFVRSGYRIDNIESREVDCQGNIKHLLKNLTGVVENGSLVQIWGSQQDISERREIETTLRQSEELYRTVIEQAEENIYLIDLETKRILQSNASLHRSLGYTMEELRELTLYDIIVHDQESIDRHIRQVMDGGHVLLGERKYRCKDGSLIDVEVSASAISFQGREVMCVVAHDVTERKRVENALRRSLGSLLALHEASQVLSSTLEAEEIGSRLLKIMQRIFNLTTAVLSTPDERQQAHVWRAIGLEDLPARLRYTPEVQRALREVLDTGEHRLFRLERPDEDPHPLVGGCLPLRIRNRTIGVLEVYGMETLLEEDTVEFLTSMTSQAASVLENAQLYGELAERERRLQELVGQLLMAQKEERQRVAYEVHDSVAQVASAAHQHLQTFARRYPPGSEKSAKDMERVIRLTGRTVREARQVIAALRPTVLDDFGLSLALYREVEELRNDGWRVDYEENLGEERLPTAVEITLFRIAQEALTNVRKHAQTRRVHVELRHWQNTVNLEVRDWGQGFEPETLEKEDGPGERIGLSGMRERIAMLSGEFELSSRVGGGTSVRASVPLSDILEVD